MPDKEPIKTRTGRAFLPTPTAERGYDVNEFKTRRGRPMLGTGPSEVVPVRLDPELKRAVDARAEAEHRSASQIIREAPRRFLDVA
jgi:Ribbon-helix-helix protein, copG family